MSIYTKNGDTGLTSLFASTKKYKKSDFVFGVLGEFDNLNANLSFLYSSNIDEVKKSAFEIQKDLFRLAAFVAGKEVLLEHVNFWEKRVTELEEAIDFFEAKLPKLDKFIFPGGHIDSNYLHLCRVSCRELERLMVDFTRRRKNLLFIVKYLNRLSDYFFVLARYVNFSKGFSDIKWES